ncbi:hypothetical protein TSAR_009499 [Trichomalopsis sarcophagae]|uniref:Cytochrome P450 n=1 Tax=Trichomalopsis sarcophagae TaxID=543379 RepID=A0A232ETR2_9HYME|nr:hypothetical protein TSAR_009499 [Trichomalopsis sarcophagae]
MDSITPILHKKLFWATALIIVIYAYFKFVIYGYWKRRGIPQNTPIIPVGNAFPLISGSIGNFMKQKYNKSKKYPVYGIYIFHMPLLLINDPNVIKLILIKEFNKFRDRGLYFNEKVNPLSVHLFLLPGERWRQLRAKLTPTFTSSKLKQMCPLLLEIGNNLTRVCDQIIKKDDIVEFKDLIGRYTTDSISSIAFGVDCQSLDNGYSEFQKHGSMAFDLPPSKNALAVFAPIILDIFRIPLFNNTMTQFFTKTFIDVLEERRRNKTTRKDFLDLLMQLLDKGSLDEDKDLKQGDNSDRKISLSEAIGQAFIFYLAGFETTSSTITYCLYTTDSISSIAFGVDCQSLDNGYSEFHKYGSMAFDLPALKNALGTFVPKLLDIFRVPLYNKAIGQAFIFYLAGFETTSSTITYCLYELALNPEIQEKVQTEIDEFSKRDGGITYEIISNDMKYLHMVFSETLRKHPSIPVINRECIEDCDIPNTNFRIEKGIKLLICMNAIHRDPNIFPDPEKFDPLRFTKENIASRQPYTYFPFGDGPRACIGIRFGMLQTKIALIGLLANYNFSVCEKTSIPVIYARRSFTQTPENGIRFGMLQTKIALIGLLSNCNFSVCEKTSIPVMYARRSFTQTPEYGIYLKTEKRNKSTFLYKNNKATFAVLSFTVGYTNDSISSIAFGVNCQNLDNGSSEFRKHGSMVFDLPPIKNALSFCSNNFRYFKNSYIQQDSNTIVYKNIALIGLLSNYTIPVCEKISIPVSYAKNLFVQTPANGIYLRVEKRNKTTFLHKNNKGQ